MESTNELVTAAEAKAEGLSLDGVANNRCITKQQFNDNLPSGGLSEEDLYLLTGTVGRYLTVIVTNNTTNTVNAELFANAKVGQSTNTTFELGPKSMKVFQLTEDYINFGIRTEVSVTYNCYIDTYDAVASAYIHNIKTGQTGSNCSIGNSNFVLHGGVLIMCISSV